MSRTSTALLLVSLLGPGAIPAIVSPPLGPGPGRAHRAFCPAGPALAACADARLAAPVLWRGGREPLDKLLRSVARRAFVPMSIVLAAPIPSIALPRRRLAPAALLDRIVRRHCYYRWSPDRGVVRFDDVRVSADRNNFLNWRLHSFTIGPDVGDDMLALHQLLGQWPTRPLMGMILAGPHATIVGRPARVILRRATGRAILLRLLRGAPAFYSQIVFPSAGPLSHAQALAAISNWIWTPLRQPPTPPPPKPCGPVKVPPGAGPNWRPAPSEACPPVPHA
jgi:hypothetical protein